jgi:hypothetical protein
MASSLNRRDRASLRSKLLTLRMEISVLGWYIRQLAANGGLVALVLGFFLSWFFMSCWEAVNSHGF